MPVAFAPAAKHTDKLSDMAIVQAALEALAI